MKFVGSYAFLFKNSIAKTTWKQYRFEDFFEQTNIIFAVLLYVMEQSLKDEPCTMDDIAGFIDILNIQSFRKQLSNQQCKELGDFIVNVILSNEGKVMYFKGFDFNDSQYKDIHISFIGNKIVYIDGDIRRTSYYLTEDGYNVLLSTLEIESNMLLNIHEMIFKLHIEKASYDKAVDDVKNIFNQLRIQLQRIQEAMRRIKQNALSYSVLDYKTILDDNLDTIGETGKKFSGYREHIREKVKTFEEQDINIKKLDKKDMDNLKNLRIIEEYLSRVIDEHQSILRNHFELKALYTKELESLSQMTLIKRFNLRNELFDKILRDARYLEDIDFFTRPLLNQEAEKTYNINKSVEIQKPIRMKLNDDEEEIISFDEDQLEAEKIEKLKKKLSFYNNTLLVILLYAKKNGGITLSEIKESLNGDYTELIPTVEIFKEVVIELIKNPTIDIVELRRERSEHISDSSVLEFQLNESILNLIDNNFILERIKKVNTYRKVDSLPVIFENLNSDTGRIKRIHCSEVYFSIE